MWWGRRELQLGNLTSANWSTHSQCGNHRGVSKVLKLATVCVVGGLRVAQLRATSVVRQASGGSNNVSKRVSVQNGVPVATYSWQALNSADGSLHLPQQAFSQDTSGVGERSREADTGLWSEKIGECFEPMQMPHSHLQAVLSKCSSLLPPLLAPSAPSPNILEHKAASVQSTRAHNPR